jgi:hypothetical protein
MNYIDQISIWAHQTQVIQNGLLVIIGGLALYGLGTALGGVWKLIR